MSVSAARAKLPRLLDRGQRGEEVTITRHGQPVAVVVRPDVLRLRRADRAFAGAAQVARLLAQGGSAPEGPGLSAVSAGADRFLTNNRRDFSADIDEISVIYPDALPELSADAVASVETD